MIDELFEKYVEIVECQISEENFGLSLEKYNDLEDKVEIAIHSAANVNHYGKYSSFEKTNVKGTRKPYKFL